MPLRPVPEGLTGLLPRPRPVVPAEPLPPAPCALDDDEMELLGGARTCTVAPRGYTTSTPSAAGGAALSSSLLPAPAPARAPPAPAELALAAPPPSAPAAPARARCSTAAASPKGRQSTAPLLTRASLGCRYLWKAARTTTSSFTVRPYALVSWLRLHPLAASPPSPDRYSTLPPLSRKARRDASSAGANGSCGAANTTHDTPTSLSGVSFALLLHKRKGETSRQGRRDSEHSHSLSSAPSVRKLYAH